MRRLLPLAAAALVAALPRSAAQDDPPSPLQVRTTVNNLKQIGLAFHNYASAHMKFPNDVYKDGKAILSWRVAILPFIEEVTVVEQFKMDEPWDGPTNKKLIEKMPKLYAPVRGTAKPGETFYRGFSGKRLPFGPEDQRTGLIRQYLDGTSNTGLVFEAGEAVPWTKPDDLTLPAKGPLPKLGGMFGGAAHVVIADGSVRTLRADADPTELRKLIDPADGMVIDPGKLFTT
jgi:hypothetical protein